MQYVTYVYCQLTSVLYHVILSEITHSLYSVLSSVMSFMASDVMWYGGESCRRLLRYDLTARFISLKYTYLYCCSRLRETYSTHTLMH